MKPQRMKRLPQAESRLAVSRSQDEQNGVDDRNESVRKVLANLTFGEWYLLQPYS
jgi:hypothetical protein